MVMGWRKKTEPNFTGAQAGIQSEAQARSGRLRPGQFADAFCIWNLQFCWSPFSFVFSGECERAFSRSNPNAQEPAFEKFNFLRC
jgi:hypothetical protein